MTKMTADQALHLLVRSLDDLDAHDDHVAAALSRALHMEQMGFGASQHDAIRDIALPVSAMVH